MRRCILGRWVGESVVSESVGRWVSGPWSVGQRSVDLIKPEKNLRVTINFEKKRYAFHLSHAIKKNYVSTFIVTYILENTFFVVTTIVGLWSSFLFS